MWSYLTSQFFSWLNSHETWSHFYMSQFDFFSSHQHYRCFLSQEIKYLMMQSSCQWVCSANLFKSETQLASLVSSYVSSITASHRIQFNISCPLSYASTYLSPLWIKLLLVCLFIYLYSDVVATTTDTLNHRRVVLVVPIEVYCWLSIYDLL